MAGLNKLERFSPTSFLASLKFSVKAEAYPSKVPYNAPLKLEKLGEDKRASLLVTTKKKF